MIPSGRTTTRVTASVVAAVTVAVSLGVPASAAQRPSLRTAATQPITFVVSIRSLSNVYQAQYVTGARAFVKWLGYPASSLKVLQSGNNDEAQLTQIQTLLSTTSGKIAINADPNTNSIAQSIAASVQRDPNAYVTMLWSKPNNLWPWQYSHWVAFIEFNGVTAAEQTANVLLQTMGGHGNIVALQGILGDLSNQQRWQGLQAFLKAHPSMKLLATESANWEETQAYTETKSLAAKYGKTLNGVWAANDEMAVGAREALNSLGLRRVPVVSASDAIPQVLTSIKAGSGIYATTDPNGYLSGSVPLALSYYAAIGKINVASLGHAKRAFYAKAELVTQHNVASVLAPFSATQYVPYWTLTGVWRDYAGPML